MLTFFLVRVLELSNMFLRQVGEKSLVFPKPTWHFDEMNFFDFKSVEVVNFHVFFPVFAVFLLQFAFYSKNGDLSAKCQVGLKKTSCFPTTLEKLNFKCFEI